MLDQGEKMGDASLRPNPYIYLFSLYHVLNVTFKNLNVSVISFDQYSNGRIIVKQA